MLGKKMTLSGHFTISGNLVNYLNVNLNFGANILSA